MKKICASAAAVIFAMVLLYPALVMSSQAAEKADTGQVASEDMAEKAKRAQEVETLITMGTMIVEEGKRTNDQMMIKNGQLMIKQGQMLKEGK